MSINEATSPLRLLVIVAHPHDITHMSGTCAHHINDGDSVTVISVTGGGLTHNEKLFDELRKPDGERDEQILQQNRDAYIDEKVQQFRQACALFGITDTRVLGFPDVPIRITDEMVNVLADIICDVRPHILLTHAPDHPVNTTISFMDDDHVDAGRAVRLAMRIANAPDPLGKRIPHEIIGIYYMGMEFPDTEVNYLVDISDQAENRLKAEALFTTQDHTPEFARKRLEVEVGHRGWNARNAAYAEPFVRAQRQVGKKLTITQNELNWSEMSRQDRRQKQSYRVT